MLGSPVVPFTLFLVMGSLIKVTNQKTGCPCHNMVAGLLRMTRDAMDAAVQSVRGEFSEQRTTNTPTGDPLYLQFYAFYLKGSYY